jgi:hypothetical protein
MIMERQQDRRGDRIHLLSDDARAAIERTDEESKQGPRAPKHEYALADYGLTEQQVKDRFTGL